MTREELIKMLEADELTLGTCRGCGHDLVMADDQDVDNAPEDEISLECSILDTQECVSGEWFKISDLI